MTCHRVAGFCKHEKPIVQVPQCWICSTNELKGIPVPMSTVQHYYPRPTASRSVDEILTDLHKETLDE